MGFETDSTLDKFSEISPTRADSYCQRTSCTKWLVLCKMHNAKFSIFHHNDAAKCDPVALEENLLNMISVHINKWLCENSFTIIPLYTNTIRQS
jgi:hypothetical protein